METLRELLAKHQIDLDTEVRYLTIIREAVEVVSGPNGERMPGPAPYIDLALTVRKRLPVST